MNLGKLSGISFLIAYVILLFIHMIDPGLRGTVIRQHDVGFSFNPFIPIKEVFDWAFSFKQYWINPSFILINLFYWWAAIFGIMYYVETKSRNSRSRQ